MCYITTSCIAPPVSSVVLNKTNLKTLKRPRKFHPLQSLLNKTGRRPYWIVEHLQKSTKHGREAFLVGTDPPAHSLSSATFSRSPPSSSSKSYKYGTQLGQRLKRVLCSDFKQTGNAFFLRLV